MYELGIVPTTGYWSNGEELIPSDQGIRRIDVLINWLEQDRQRAGAFVGGQNKNYELSEAFVYWEHFRHRRPDLKDRIEYIDARAHCTARDMWRFAQRLGGGGGFGSLPSRIIIFSYHEHLWRAMYSLKWALRWTFWSSVELRGVETYEVNYSRFKEAVLCTITVLDPFWIWLGLPLVWLANQRGHNE